MLRKRFSPRSLSARVFWLVVLISLLVELAVVLPEMGTTRQNWLWQRVEQGNIAAAAIRDEAVPVSPHMSRTLLLLSRTIGVTLSGGQTDISLAPEKMPVGFGADIYLDKESLGASIWRGSIAILGLSRPYARVYARIPAPSTGQIEVIVSQRFMAQQLRQYMMRAVLLGVILAIVAATLVFLALDRLLVRPMQVMTASIAGIRRNPGHAGRGGLKWLAGRGDDEISRAARELVGMQDELRAALWRNARLAALGTAVAKISHDLRNILTSALLVADRLHRHDDLVVQQAANTLIPAMERAVELVSRALDFAQEGPPTHSLSDVAVHALVNEVADMLRATDGSVTVSNLLPETLVMPVDRSQIYRVLVNLLRNSVEAGATRITLKLEGANSMALLLVIDNGPGLPAKVIPNLFRPFTGAGRNGGTGLGLTIARDLVRAHGGDLVLRHTGPEGTVFVISLPREWPEKFPGPPIAG